MSGTLVCCGVRIDVTGFDAAVDRLLTKDSAGRAVHLCNAYTLSLARRDGGYAEVLNRGDLNLPDGKPLAWLGKRLGLSERADRVYGPDLMLATIDRGRAVGLRHYLYGSRPEVVERLRERLEERFPGVTVVGAESPPFRELTEDEGDDLVERVRGAEADVVWVGLGTPAQDRFVDEFRGRLGASLVAVGAAFDFIAGVKRQAPVWMQRSGLEWSFRLATEPRRLLAALRVRERWVPGGRGRRPPAEGRLLGRRGPFGRRVALREATRRCGGPVEAGDR